MEIQLIKGNTYAINYPSAVGVYVFCDNSCVLIDSGASSSFAKKTLKLITDKGFKVKGIINTHSHADHCGGNQYIQNITNCPIYSSITEAPFLENPVLEAMYIYSASSIKSLKSKFILPPKSTVTNRVEPGKEKINGVEFRFIDLSGHSLGQIGIETPDGVLFAGDSLIAARILNNHPFLYLVDVYNHICSFNTLSNCPSDYVYLSHGGMVNDLGKLIQENRNALDRILDALLDIIKLPKGREEILQQFVKNMKLPLNLNGYFRRLSSISAYLSFLCNKELARVWLENDLIKFQKV